MAEKGIEIEIQKELYYNMMNVAATLNKQEQVKSIQKDIIKTIFPDIKTGDETLMDVAKKLIPDSGEKLRIKADTKMTIKDENPLNKFRR